MLTNCKKPIFKQFTGTPANYLVVNGNITPGDTTVITLSRLVSITDSTTKSNPELNATVIIEGSQNGSYTLTSKNNGTYVTASLNFSAQQNYRIKITTSNGRQYASDFVPLKNSPPIDSVNYSIKNDGVQIYANTHDATNNSRYYRWDYAETYIIHSEYLSKYMEVGHDTIVSRDADHQIYQCWTTEVSGNLPLASSAKLAQDVIVSQAVGFVPSTSEKLRFRYSILVNQYALTPDAYNYFTLLQKNSAQVGGIFDAQPSELTGNIHCLTNPGEPVIGYVTAGSASRSRIFIANSQLPGWVYTDPNNNIHTCPTDSLLYLRVICAAGGGCDSLYEVHQYIYSDLQIPLDTLPYPSPRGFTAGFAPCVDCTLRGTNKKPSFWK